MHNYPINLANSVGSATRGLALEQLGLVGRAARRLGRTTDPEALHTLRVRLRRLRSLLRGHGSTLRPGVKAKTRNRLRDLAHATNDCRDGQVQLAFLHAQLANAGLGVRSRQAVAWLLERIQSQHDRAMADLRRGWPEEFAKVRRKLRRQLRRAHPARPHKSPSFRHAVAQLLDVQADTLVSQLARLAETAPSRSLSLSGRGEGVGSGSGLQEGSAAAAVSAGDVSTGRAAGGGALPSGLHEIRLGVKRLRYAVEPLAHDVESARALVSGLKGLQDQLGQLRDLEVLAEHIADEAHAAAADWIDLVSREALSTIDQDSAPGTAGTAGSPGTDIAPGLSAAAALRRSMDHLWELARLLRVRRAALLADLGPSWPHEEIARQLAQTKLLATELLGARDAAASVVPAAGQCESFSPPSSRAAAEDRGMGREPQVYRGQNELKPR